MQAYQIQTRYEPELRVRGRMVVVSGRKGRGRELFSVRWAGVPGRDRAYSQCLEWVQAKHPGAVEYAWVLDELQKRIDGRWVPEETS